jgi:hypothetical protein
MVFSTGELVMFRNFKNVCLVAFVVCVIAAWAVPCQANLILNGSFETGKTFTVLTSVPVGAQTPSTGIADWTTAQTGGQSVWNYYAQNDWGEATAQDGTRDVCISSSYSSNPSSMGGARSILQSFTVQQGYIYDVTYYARTRRNNTWNNPLEALLTIDSGILDGEFVTGPTGATLSGDLTNALKLTSSPPVSSNPPVSLDWVLHHFTFAPSLNGTATLKFTVTLPQVTTGNCDIFLDNVSVEGTQIVPEPSTLALLAAGLFGLLAYAWRKRK